MTDKKEKSLRARFLSAQKQDKKNTSPKNPSFPNSFCSMADHFPEAHKSLLDYAAIVKNVYLEQHVVMMERVSKAPNPNWSAHWRHEAAPVIEHTMSSVPETANIYHLQQLEGYKKIHEICRQKDVDVQVSLKQVERGFITMKKVWAVVIDISKPYSSSPDAAIFKTLFKQEKKANKAAKPAA